MSDYKYKKNEHLDALEAFMNEFCELMESHSKKLEKAELFHLTIRCTEKYFNEKEHFLHWLNIFRLHSVKLHY